METGVQWCDYEYRIIRFASSLCFKELKDVHLRKQKPLTPFPLRKQEKIAYSDDRGMGSFKPSDGLEVLFYYFKQFLNLNIF